MRKMFCLALLLGLIVFSCKKGVSPRPEGEKNSTERTSDQLLKDSIYYYYKLNSFWEKSIPKYDDIAKFTDTISSAQKVLDILKSKTPFFAGYLGPYDRFSYFNNLDGHSTLSANLKMDENDGYGLLFSIGAISTEIAYPIIHFVEGGSSASLAGLERSDAVLELNGMDTEIDIKCADGRCLPVNVVKYNAIRDHLMKSLKGNNIHIKVQKDDQSIKEYSLVYSTYEIDPLTLDTVFEFSNKNVGYFVYSSFEKIDNTGIGLKNKNALDQVFVGFSSKGVKDLIVDLRYNSGGYVNAATYMADKIINSNGDKKLMLKYELNEYLTKQNSRAFRDVYFSKRNGNLEFETVCFIVSESTASASELLINVLKPYMNVKVIAETDRTYGKPVGFFEQKIMDRISLWVTSFKLLNADGHSDYWLGLDVDMKDVDDYIFSNFGDKNEKMIAAALTFTGVQSKPSIKAQGMSRSSVQGSKMKMDGVNAMPHKGALK